MFAVLFCSFIIQLHNSYIKCAVHNMRIPNANIVNASRFNAIEDEREKIMHNDDYSMSNNSHELYAEHESLFLHVKRLLTEISNKIMNSWIMKRLLGAYHTIINVLKRMAAFIIQHFSILIISIIAFIMMVVLFIAAGSI